MIAVVNQLDCMRESTRIQVLRLKGMARAEKDCYFGRLNATDSSFICTSVIPSGSNPMLRALT